MSDFLGTFLAVFLAVTFGEIAKEMYARWLKDRVSHLFDRVDEHKNNLLENVKLK